MAFKTGISWTDHTHNFWYGCKKVSPGCLFCYAERDMKRFGHTFTNVRRSQTFNKPLSWKDPALVFVNSWSDFFIDKADDWRDEAWAIIRRTPHLTYQILTKRVECVYDDLPDDWGSGYPNVWLGVSVESSRYLYRLDLLARIPCILRFISYEPALGPVNFEPYLNSYQWLIAGGESGRNWRVPEMKWFFDVRDQCQRTCTAFFFKQVGGHTRIDGVWGGDKLDGRVYHQFPGVTNK